MAFKKGRSGNPAGRPPGVGRNAELRKAIAEDLPSIIQAMVQAARGGDVGAARLLLDRALPALKPEAAPLTLPGLGAGSLSARAEAVLASVARGELSHDAGAALVASIGGLAKIQELSELEARLTALESKMEGKA